MPSIEATKQKSIQGGLATFIAFTAPEVYD